ncbi:MAG: hypothetical protein ACPGTO_07575, partial [Polaribacter sp.]
ILIKLTCLIGLVVAPILGGHNSDNHATAEANVWITKNGEKHEIKVTSDAKFVSKKEMKKVVKVNIEKNDDGTAKAIITTTTIENDKEVTKDEVIEGTLEEVKAKLKDIEGVEIKLKEKN